VLEEKGGKSFAGGGGNHRGKDKQRMQRKKTFGRNPRWATSVIDRGGWVVPRGGYKTSICRGKSELYMTYLSGGGGGRALACTSLKVRGLKESKRGVEKN